MLGADTFVSSILRLVSTVAILAAVYFLIIKPVLSTTKDVVHHASKQASQQQRASRIARDKAELHVARQPHHPRALTAEHLDLLRDQPRAAGQVARGRQGPQVPGRSWV